MPEGKQQEKEENMKKIIIAGILGMVLISLASAALVGFLSNTVSATVEVSGPVFYLDKYDIMGDQSYSLKMNDDNIIDNGTFTIGDSYKLKEFYSEILNIDNFYDHNFYVSLITEAANYSGNESGEIKIIIDIVEDDGKPRNIELCNVGMIGIKAKDKYFALCECNSNTLDKMNPSDRLRLSLWDWSNAQNNEVVYIYGNSKFQVVAT